VHHYDALGGGPSWLLSQPGQVSNVARQQENRPRLGQRDDSKESVKGASMPGQPGAAKQFPGRPALLPAQRYHANAGQGVVHVRVAAPAAKNLGEGRGSRHDLGTAPVRMLDTGTGGRMTASELDQAFGIEDQGAA
jgi:hypothetical protein